VLPEDVLLEIFYFYVGKAQGIQAWRYLVHVCRPWRSVVFGSPRRLNLQLVCTAKTRALDIWPALPLQIRGRGDLRDSLDAVLELSDRVRGIDLRRITSWHSGKGKLSTAMAVPFPELRNLRLESSDGEVVLPDSFLGGSAPRLGFLHLDRISYLGLPKLLSSATHLVQLNLQNIPHSGYISSDAMVTAISTLTRLKTITLEFQSPRPHSDRAGRRLPPTTRSVFSVLTYIYFKGDSEYLDDLVANINAPRLSKLDIIFVLDTPQLIQFISRTPRLEALEKARVIFGSGGATVNLSSLTSGDYLVRVEISCRDLDRQVSSMRQVCTCSLPPLSNLEDLYILDFLSPRARWQDNIENSLWLGLLHPFRATQDLYLSEEFARRIGPALQELVGSRASEVLPSLQNIFLEGLRPSVPVQEGIRRFVATRRITSDAMAVFRWKG
jgi:hypothetical protein